MKKDVPGLTIRCATPADAELLAEMVAAFAAYERLPSQATPDSIRAELSRTDKVIEAPIAFVDGVPVGFAVFFQTFSTFASRRGIYLEDIFVKDSFRNKGIATALLKYVAKLAVERDVARVEFAVLLWNTVAIEFFETQGATPNSAWTLYRLSGEWLRKMALP